MSIKRLFRNWLLDEPNQFGSDVKVPTERLSRKTGVDFKHPMNIVLYNAVGGRIVKFWSYSGDHDELYEQVYLITDEENFEESLGKYIALEAIKHVG